MHLVKVTLILVNEILYLCVPGEKGPQVGIRGAQFAWKRTDLRWQHPGEFEPEHLRCIVNIWNIMMKCISDNKIFGVYAKYLEYLRWILNIWNI